MNSIHTKLFIVITTLVIMLGMSALYLQNSTFMRNINNILIDSAFLYRGAEVADKRIVIVDVDEESLQALGQWPWSRHKVARVLDNLTAAGVGIIGLDMVFSEKDNSSPRTIAKEANISAENLVDFDSVLANSLANSPTITGFIFDFEHDMKREAPATNAIFIQKGRGEEESLLQAKGITSNIPILQEYAYSSGSFNTLPDSDVIVRYVPLLFSYDDAIYPSLSFEMIRVMLGEKKVTIAYDESGVSDIHVGEVTIPTDEEGRLFVNYRGAKKSYEYISALDIYHDSFDKKKIEGAIVLIGTSAAGLLDLRATPFDSSYPGVEVHANVIDNILNNDLIAAPSYARGADMTALVMTVLLMSIFLSFASPMLSFGLVLGAFGFGATFYLDIMFEEHLLLNFAFPLLSGLLTVFALTFINIYQENRQKMLITDKFSKKVSPQVAAKLLKNAEDAFSATQTEVTIFFSDIRNFTAISEGFGNPNILIDYLNRYMSPMSEIIIKHEGTIDKYIGDAIMAYWNAPLPVANHADHALSAAIEQIKALGRLNKELEKDALPPIEIGIGLHTGLAIVGEMGSKGRSDYTAIGDSINLGSRIEGLCKPYGAKILISEATKEALTKPYKLREIDRVQVKGKEEAVRIYEVFDFGDFSEEEAVLETLYTDAKGLYFDGKFKEAYALFYHAFEQKEQKIFSIYMDRCAEYQKSESKEVRNVHRLTTK